MVKLEHIPERTRVKWLVFIVILVSIFVIVGWAISFKATVESISQNNKDQIEMEEVQEDLNSFLETITISVDKFNEVKNVLVGREKVKSVASTTSTTNKTINQEQLEIIKEKIQDQTEKTE